jgi:hypothetical protein
LCADVPGTYLYEMLFSKEEKEHCDKDFKLMVPKKYK